VSRQWHRPQGGYVLSTKPGLPVSGHCSFLPLLLDVLPAHRPQQRAARKKKQARSCILFLRRLKGISRFFQAGKHRSFLAIAHQCHQILENYKRNPTCPQPSASLALLMELALLTPSFWEVPHLPRAAWWKPESRTCWIVLSPGRDGLCLAWCYCRTWKAHEMSLLISQLNNSSLSWHGPLGWWGTTWWDGGREDASLRHLHEWCLSL